MSRERIDYQSVAKIADAIKAQGEKPSITLVGNMLGVYENAPMLSKYLEEWYRHQPEFQRSQFTPNMEIEPMRYDADVIAKNRELENTLSLIRATLESTADGILIVNKQGAVVDWNQKFADMWRIPAGLLEAGPEGPGFAYILEQVEDPQALVAEVTKLYDNANEGGNLGEIRFKDGRVFERYSQPHRINGEIVGRVWSFRDVTEQRFIEQRLKLRECAIESSPNGVFMIEIVGDEHKIIYVNPAFEKMTGYTEEDVLGTQLNVLLGDRQNQVTAHRFALAISEQREDEVALQCFRKSGESFWAEINIAPVPQQNNKSVYFVGMMTDITQRRKMEQQLIHQATYDGLTNLPNRSLLVDRVQQAIIQARKNEEIVALLFLDLDRFKLINDSLGHSMGDKILQMVSTRLLKATRAGDTIARIGGDEFVVVLPSLKAADHALPIARKILESLNQPFFIEKQEFNITSSIGVSFYPKDGNSFEDLLRNADLSMYSAKDSGRNNIKLFDQDMHIKIESRVQMEKELRTALEKKELELYYQPLVDLKTNNILGNEALLRWQNPTLGFVLPLKFVPLMEENGMIIEVGDWIIEDACRQTAMWQKMGYGDLRVAVNISGIQFKNKQLPKTIDRILKKTGLNPKSLEIEITESILVDNIDEILDSLHQIREIGVSIAIDDFGTGYSSLAYLKSFPVDMLKIDRSFVQDISKNQHNMAITRAIISLARSLELTVIAEGVETEEQLKFLKEHGCDIGQGYYFSKPITVTDLEKLMKKK